MTSGPGPATTLVVTNVSPIDERDVALWRTSGLVVPHDDPTADFRFAVAGPCSAVLVGRDGAARRSGAMADRRASCARWCFDYPLKLRPR